MNHRSLALVGFVSALVTSGCGGTTRYVPTASPRVSIVENGGATHYVRDGILYRGGAFGGEIIEAVAGNPEAEQYAREYKAGITAGTTMLWGGILTAVAGLAVAVASDANQQQGVSPAATAGFAIAGAGLVIELIGAIITVNARPRLYDAINSYNDALGRSGTGPDR